MTSFTRTPIKYRLRSKSTLHHYDEYNHENHKENIQETFNNNLKGNKLGTPIKKATKHCGKEGHWVEELMGSTHDSKNEPDLFGSIELKVGTKRVTTLGDWSPNVGEKWWQSEETKLFFFQKFGIFNPKKSRWSWTNLIKYEVYNKCGQKLAINNDGVFVVYNRLYDTFYENRPLKSSYDVCTIVGWKHDYFEMRFSNKFSKGGVVICKKNDDGYFDKLVFTDPRLYVDFLRGLKSLDVFLSPGTYQGNPRPYMMWRCFNKWL